MQTNHTWTEAAKAELERHFQNIRAGLIQSGADASEVEDDIRRHIDHEAAKGGLNVLTQDDVKRFIARMGSDSGPGSGTPDGPTSHAPATPSAYKEPRTPTIFRMSRAWVVFNSIILPVVTLCIELSVGWCASSFLDPIPTVFHVILIGLIPLTACFTLRDKCLADAATMKWLAPLNAFVSAVAFYYALVFLPLTPFALIGIFWFGAGLLPLSPLLSFIALLNLRREIYIASDFWNRPRPKFWPGFIAGFLVLLLLEAPTILTSVGFNMADDSNSSSAQSNGVRMLRLCGNNDLMIRSCYPSWSGFGRSNVRSLLLGFFLHPVQPESAQKTYFRVTGTPFNSVPPPDLRTLRGDRRTNREDFQWDRAQGGENVAARIKGLTLNESRLDSIVDPVSRTVYTEWIMIFRNDSGVQREARTQIALPPQGVVSRVTLWVNGEEREAAYSGRQQVKEAYQKVAIQQRRDPVLVTTSGRDQVLMQCFPIPPNGGTMKIKIGVTCPIDLESAHSGLVRLPYIRERNFGILDGFRHSLWFESPDAVTLIAPATGELGNEPVGHSGSAIRGRVDDNLLCSELAFRCECSSTNLTSWAKAKDGTAPAIISQHLAASTAAAPDHVVLVIDGSTWMKDYASSLATTLERLPAQTPITLITAGDEPTIEASSIQLSKGKASLRNIVANYNYIGGRDNLAALTVAWNEAAKTPHGVILWIHATQPVLLSGIEELAHSWERRPDRPLLYDYQVGDGPDRIAEQLAPINAFQPIPNYGSLTTDLPRLFSEWTGATPIYRYDRARQDGLEQLEGIPEGSSHIARLWANEEVLRLAGSIHVDDIRRAIDLAVTYHLVTPVSGAVVLETAAQYQQSGLSPIDAQDAPHVSPEPGTIIMLCIGGTIMIITIRRKRRHNAIRAA